MLKLVLRLKGSVMEEFTLEKDLISIGRSPENDIVIDNIAISRRHAQIELKEETGYVVRDLKSSNGTFLNGIKIEGRDYALKEGDILGLAKFELAVKQLSRATTPPPKAPSLQDVEGTMIIDAAKPKPGAEAPGAPAAQAFQWPILTARSGPQEGRAVKINKDITTIGSGPHDDLTVGGWFVSAPQAKITRHGERFYISHVGSFFSSTKVNGIAIKAEHILKNKDEIQIGDTTFVFTQFSKNPSP